MTAESDQTRTDWSDIAIGVLVGLWLFVLTAGALAALVHVIGTRL